MTSARSERNDAARAALRARVGAFIRKRLRQLGLHIIDVTTALGYRSTIAVSNIEQWLEGVPAKRAYAWAEVLEVPRDAFFQFVIGETSSLGATIRKTAPNHLGALS